MAFNVKDIVASSVSKQLDKANNKRKRSIDEAIDLTNNANESNAPSPPSTPTGRQHAPEDASMPFQGKTAASHAYPRHKASAQHQALRRSASSSTICLQTAKTFREAPVHHLQAKQLPPAPTHRRKAPAQHKALLENRRSSTTCLSFQTATSQSTRPWKA